jgi:hypothetical protein
MYNHAIRADRALFLRSVVFDFSTVELALDYLWSTRAAYPLHTATIRGTGDTQMQMCWKGITISYNTGIDSIGVT